MSAFFRASSSGAILNNDIRVDFDETNEDMHLMVYAQNSVGLAKKYSTFSLIAASFFQIATGIMLWVYLLWRQDGADEDIRYVDFCMNSGTKFNKGIVFTLSLYPMLKVVLSRIVTERNSQAITQGAIRDIFHGFLTFGIDIFICGTTYFLLYKAVDPLNMIYDVSALHFISEFDNEIVSLLHAAFGPMKIQKEEKTRASIDVQHQPKKSAACCSPIFNLLRTIFAALWFVGLLLVTLGPPYLAICY